MKYGPRRCADSYKSEKVLTVYKLGNRGLPRRAIFLIPDSNGELRRAILVLRIISVDDAPNVSTGRPCTAGDPRCRYTVIYGFQRHQQECRLRVFQCVNTVANHVAIILLS